MTRKLTVPMVAAHLQVPEKTIYHWRSTGYGPRAVRVGRRLLFDEADVERWFEELAEAQAQGVSR